MKNESLKITRLKSKNKLFTSILSIWLAHYGCVTCKVILVRWIRLHRSFFLALNQSKFISRQSFSQVAKSVSRFEDYKNVTQGSKFFMNRCPIWQKKLQTTYFYCIKTMGKSALLSNTINTWITALLNTFNLFLSFGERAWAWHF